MAFEELAFFHIRHEILEIFHAEEFCEDAPPGGIDLPLDLDLDGIFCFSLHSQLCNELVVIARSRSVATKQSAFIDCFGRFAPSQRRCILFKYLELDLSASL